MISNPELVKRFLEIKLPSAFLLDPKTQATLNGFIKGQYCLISIDRPNETCEILIGDALPPSFWQRFAQ